jgi:hypothetical protein
MERWQKWLMIAAFVAFVVFVPVLDTGTIGGQILGYIQKGGRVGNRSTMADNANVDQAPEDLAASAGLDVDTYALARMISSEEGNSANIRQAAVAWVMVNNGGTGYAIPRGIFGRQGSGGRPISTSQDPYEGHVEIARGVMDGSISDPTGGARFFIAPRTQDALHARDPVKYKSFATVEASRLADGLRRVEVEGIDPDLLVFYT